MASPEATALWEAFRSGAKMIDMPLAQRRMAGEHAEDGTSEPESVSFSTRPDGSLLAVPENARPGAAVLYLFGGGYVLGSPASRRKTAGHIATASSCQTLAASYRLAPEHPFPAALDDAVAAFDQLVTDGARPESVVLCGDSAGGGLALAVALALRDRGTECAGYVGLSPWADLTCSGTSMSENADVDVECSRTSLLEMAGQYLAGHDPTDPMASPVFADMAGLAPSLIIVGGDEVLLDDAVQVTRAHGASGGDATLMIVGGCQHVFPIWCGMLPEADNAIAAIGAWVRRRIE